MSDHSSHSNDSSQSDDDSDVDISFSQVDISFFPHFHIDSSFNTDISFVNGLKIITQTIHDISSGNIIFHTVAFTEDPSDNLQIFEDLSAVIQTYDDISNASIMDEIRFYASKINCKSFQGKGSINDYAELFNIASKLAKEAKQTTLSVDIDGFQSFGNAADELASVFSEYILKLQNINVVNDSEFLNSIAISLKQIYNLSTVFAKLKETILETTIIQIPKSLQETEQILEGVMSEVDCAMKYINHFVSPELDISLCSNAEMDPEDKKMIQEAIHTITNWNENSHGNVQIAISENADIQFIKNANAIIKNTSQTLKNSTAILKGKIKLFCK